MPMPPHLSGRLAKLERQLDALSPQSELAEDQQWAAAWLTAHSTDEIARAYAAYVRGQISGFWFLLEPIEWVVDGLPPRVFDAQWQEWRAKLLRWMQVPRGYLMGLEQWMRSEAFQHRWLDPLYGRSDAELERAIGALLCRPVRRADIPDKDWQHLALLSCIDWEQEPIPEDRWEATVRRRAKQQGLDPDEVLAEAEAMLATWERYREDES